MFDCSNTTKMFSHHNLEKRMDKGELTMDEKKDIKETTPKVFYANGVTAATTNYDCMINFKMQIAKSDIRGGIGERETVNEINVFISRELAKDLGRLLITQAENQDKIDRRD